MSYPEKSPRRKTSSFFEARAGQVSPNPVDGPAKSQSPVGRWAKSHDRWFNPMIILFFQWLIGISCRILSIHRACFQDHFAQLAAIYRRFVQLLGWTYVFQGGFSRYFRERFRISHRGATATQIRVRKGSRGRQHPDRDRGQRSGSLPRNGDPKLLSKICHFS